METIKKITSFKQIKEIIEKVPADKFQTHAFGMSRSFGDNNGPEDNGKSCFLGHIHRHFDPEDEGRATGDYDGYGARHLTKQMIEEVHGLYNDGADVNNYPTINGYTEPEIKDRLMHMIEDGIKWEESKKLG